MNLNQPHSKHRAVAVAKRGAGVDVNAGRLEFLIKFPIGIQHKRIGGQIQLFDYNDFNIEDIYYAV